MKQEKKVYASPEIVRVNLDNEISMALMSVPPDDPDWGMNSTPANNNGNPYHEA